MILRTNKPHKHGFLDQATELAKAILEYAVEKVGPFNEKDFINHFKEKGNWLLNGPVDVSQGIKGLFVLSDVDRKILLDVFINDTSFYKYVDDGDYHFQFPLLSDPNQEAMKKLLIPFYEKILGGSGFKHLEGQEEGFSYKRKDFLDGYKEANGQVGICPVCLGQMQGLDDSLKEDTEHYFPKESYPSLAVSSHNLIPVCQFCNRNLHGSVDPIEDHTCSKALHRIYIPYVRSGMTDIRVLFTTPGEREKVEIVPRDEQDILQKARIANLNRTYKLQRHWTYYIKEIDEIVFRRIINNLCRTGCSEQELEAAIKSEIIFHKQNKAIAPHSFLSYQYLQWIYKEPKAREVFNKRVQLNYGFYKEQYDHDLDDDE